MQTLEQIIEAHEGLKSKGMALTEADAMERLNLYDALGDAITEKESEIEEIEIDLKLARGVKSAEIQDQHSNAKKLDHALDVAFATIDKEVAMGKVWIKGATRKYGSLGKYHDMAKKIIYK